MNDIGALSAVLMAGILLGAFFFGGLWWTVRRGLSSDHPAALFLGSTLLRTGIAVVGFYFIAHGDWQKLLICLLGFCVARIAVTKVTKTGEGVHAA